MRSIRLKRKRYLGNIVGNFLSYLFPTKVLSEIAIDLFRNSPFFWGYGIRLAAYRKLCVHVGKNVVFEPNVFIIDPSFLNVGDDVVVHEFSYINTGEAEIFIGNNVAIGTHLKLVTNCHNYVEYTNGKRNKGNVYKPIIIKDNVWLGTNVTVLGGSIIQEGAVVGAGAVVNGIIVEPFSVYVGVPARIVKRFNVTNTNTHDPHEYI